MTLRKLIKAIVPTAAFLFIFFMISGSLQAKEIKLAEHKTMGDLSLKMEVQHAIEKGLRWLKDAQNPKGYWSQPDHPALTALVLTAYLGEPLCQTLYRVLRLAACPLLLTILFRAGRYQNTVCVFLESLQYVEGIHS